MLVFNASIYRHEAFASMKHFNELKVMPRRPEKAELCSVNVMHESKPTVLELQGMIFKGSVIFLEYTQQTNST